MKKSVILGHIKRIFPHLLFWMLCVGIFSGVFSLYQIPLEPICYAATLCLLLGIIFEGIDSYRFSKKHELLEEMQNTITVHLENLPVSSDLIGSDYERLLHILHKENTKLQYQVEDSRREMVDYYTMWAHQIKTPIAAMHLLIQSEDIAVGEELDMELFKVEQYVEMVLSYLRMEHMSNDLNLRLYNIETIINSAVRKYSRMFILKNISLEMEHISCRVVTDKKWLGFVMEQLLSNALKYTNRGSIRIYLHPHMKNTLVIEDEGIGIQEEDLPRVFERGFTGYNGRKDKKSTGIGLYLCKQILDKLSHAIKIESKVGIGTQVLLTLDREERVYE